MVCFPEEAAALPPPLALLRPLPVLPAESAAGPADHIGGGGCGNREGSAPSEDASNHGGINGSGKDCESGGERAPELACGFDWTWAEELAVLFADLAHQASDGADFGQLAGRKSTSF